MGGRQHAGRDARHAAVLVADDGLAIEAERDGLAHAHVLQGGAAQVKGEVGVLEGVRRGGLEALILLDDGHHQGLHRVLHQRRRTTQQRDQAGIVVLDDLKRERLDGGAPSK